MKIKASNKNDISKLSKMNKVIERKIIESISNKDYNEIGSFISRLIRVRTRLGFGVESEGKQRSKLEKLKDSTLKSRVRAKEKGTLSQYTTVPRSNLTATGEMLESISWKRTLNILKVFIPDTSRKDGSKASNRELAEYLQKGRKDMRKRVFFNVSGPEIKQISRFIQQIVKAILKRKKLKLD